MPKFVIYGGTPLKGRVAISGRKNSVLALLPATLLAAATVELDHVPAISDVDVYFELLEQYGATVTQLSPGRFAIDTASAAPAEVEPALARRIRASYYLWGAALGRWGHFAAPLPGGDEIGHRPVDQHIKGFTALGAEVWLEHGVLHGRAPKGLVGANIYLDVASVGATVNILLAAVLATGMTTLHNAAREPHIVDLANLLNGMGAKISGAGTDTIRIRGVEQLRGATHTVIPDDLEGATFMMMAAATGGDLTLDQVIPQHLAPVSAKLREAGVEVSEYEESIRVIARGRSQAVNIKTLPYPGFPTDAQSQAGAWLASAAGSSYITETLYEDRFRYVGELLRMGADITVQGRTAYIEGVPRLQGAAVQATDIRSGAALVLAGLTAEGQTVVHGVEHLHRGYEAFVEKLQAIGAEITFVEKG